MVPGYAADPQMAMMQPSIQTIPGSHTVLVPIEVPPGYDPQAYGAACAAAASAVTAAAFANGSRTTDLSAVTEASEGTQGSSSSGDALLQTLNASAQKLKAELGDASAGLQPAVMMPPQVYTPAVQQQYMISSPFSSPYAMAMVPQQPPPPPKGGPNKQYDEETEARLDEWCVAKRKKDFAMA